MLIILGGLPGSGKSTLARALASRLPGIWLRIDSIEQAIRGSALQPPARDLVDAGYMVSYSLAFDNLCNNSVPVIADSVNPLACTRQAWRDVAHRAGCPSLEVEILCGDPVEHQRRVETRQASFPGQHMPDWAQVQAREYEPWPEAKLVLDTASRAVEDCLACIEREIPRIPGRFTPVTSD